MLRVCKICGEEKDLECFTKAKDYKYGRTFRCKSCHVLEVRNSQIKHIEKYKEYNHFYDTKKRKRSNEYYEKLRAYSKEWWKNKKEETDGLYSVWRSNRRRGLIKESDDDTIDVNTLKELIKIQENKCYYCGEFLIKKELEHKIPLFRGGKHSINNVCYSCEKCNDKKSLKTEKEFKNLIIKE